MNTPSQLSGSGTHMNAHGAFSGPSTPSVSTLLNTVNDLRADLEKALKRLELYDEQNSTLTNNYNLLKNELIDARKKYQEVKTAYLQQVARTSDIEKQHEEFILKIKLQLVEKTKEFDSLRDKFKPQDLDTIKMKIQEEFEVSHQIQLSGVRSELEEYKDLYFTTRNACELLKVENEVKSNQFERQLEDAVNKYDELNHFIHEKMRIWADNKHLLQKDDIIRNQSIKIHELESMISNMKDECNSYHSKYENISKDTDHMLSKNAEIINELKSKLKLCEAEKYNLEEKLKYLQVDVDKKDMSVRMLKIQVDEWRDKAETLHNTVDDVNTQAQAERDDHSKEIQTLTFEHESMIYVMKEQLASVTSKLHDREELIKKLQKQSSEMQLRFESSERELRRINQQAIADQNKRNSALELELASVKRDYSSKVYQNNVEQEQHKNEKDASKSEISRLKREKDILHEKLREAERRLQAMNSLETAAGEQKMKESKLQKEINNLKVCIRDMERAHEALVLKHDLLTREHNAYVETVTQETKHRLTSIQITYKNKIEEMKSKLTELQGEKMRVVGELDKEKKRSKLYKEKAIEAHKQCKILSGIVTEENIYEAVDL